MTEMAEMQEEMRKLKEMVVGLQMSQSVLISHHNAHTALLEWHQCYVLISGAGIHWSNHRVPMGYRKGLGFNF